jgi:hypothetical protein
MNQPLFDLPNLHNIKNDVLGQPSLPKDWTGNFRSVVGCLGASNHSDGEREVNDFYATDPVAAEWLIQLEELNHNIWECACGGGHLGKVFENHGFNVKATDLVDRGYGQGGVDFLACEEKFDGDIITNPPYKYSLPFIEHALSLVPDGHKVCMVLKVQFLEGKERKRLFLNTPQASMGIQFQNCLY